VFDGDPATPRTEGTPTTTQFLTHVYCGQTAVWMKTPVGTEVDLSPGHIVLDGVPALLETGTAASIFSAGVYCGHGRPSQLLLSSCENKICASTAGVDCRIAVISYYISLWCSCTITSFLIAQFEICACLLNGFYCLSSAGLHDVFNVQIGLLSQVCIVIPTVWWNTNADVCREMSTRIQVPVTL